MHRAIISTLIIAAAYFGLASPTQLEVELQRHLGCTIELFVESPAESATYNFLTMNNTVILDTVETKRHAVAFDGCEITHIVVIELENGKSSRQKKIETKFAEVFSNIEPSVQLQYGNNYVDLIFDEIKWSEKVEYKVGLLKIEGWRWYTAVDRHVRIDDCHFTSIGIYATTAMRQFKTQEKVLYIDRSAFCLTRPIVSYEMESDHVNVNVLGPLPNREIVYVFEPYYGNGKLADLVKENQVGHARFANCQVEKVYVWYKRGVNSKSKRFEQRDLQRLIFGRLNFLPELQDLIISNNSVQIRVNNPPHSDSLTNLYEVETRTNTSFKHKQLIRSGQFSVSDCETVKIHVYARDRCGSNSWASTIDVAEAFKKICRPKPKVRQVFLDSGMTLIFDHPMEAIKYKFETSIDGKKQKTHVQQTRAKTFRDCRITGIEASYEDGNGQPSYSQYFGNVTNYLNAKPPNPRVRIEGPNWSFEELNWRVQLFYSYSVVKFQQTARDFIQTSHGVDHTMPSDCDITGIVVRVENGCKTTFTQDSFEISVTEKCVEAPKLIAKIDGSRGLVLTREGKTSEELTINLHYRQARIVWKEDAISVVYDFTKKKKKFEKLQEIVTDCNLEVVSVSRDNNKRSKSFYFDAASSILNKKPREPKCRVIEEEKELKIMVTNEPWFRPIKNYYHSLLIENGSMILEIGKEKASNYIYANDGCQASSTYIDWKQYVSKKSDVASTESGTDSNSNETELKPDLETLDNDDASDGTGKEVLESVEEPNTVDYDYEKYYEDE